MSENYFRLADWAPVELVVKMRQMNREKGGVKILAKSIGVYRRPRAGEWYLSGADIAAYRAKGDLSAEYHIARLVLVRRIEVVTYKEVG